MSLQLLSLKTEKMSNKARIQHEFDLLENLVAFNLGTSLVSSRIALGSYLYALKNNYSWRKEASNHFLSNAIQQELSYSSHKRRHGKKTIKGIVVALFGSIDSKCWANDTTCVELVRVHSVIEWSGSATEEPWWGILQIIPQGSSTVNFE